MVQNILMNLTLMIKEIIKYYQEIYKTIILGTSASSISWLCF